MLVSATDVVFVNTIQLSTSVGKDHWGRNRDQTVLLSVYLHLSPTFLDASGHTDNVEDSVHYGHLTKAISSRVSQRKEPYPDAHALVEDATKAAFELSGDTVDAVRVVVELPKQILLADGFSVEVTTPKGDTTRDSPAIVRVNDLVLPVLIGVNPPERLAKQRVITNITFYEKARAAHTGSVDYPDLVKKITMDIDQTTFLTLEKFVLEIVRTGCLASPDIEGVTVRCQKPSALSFAHSSGVEITRKRDAFI
ncbi:Dihydroneopterin aldolase-domain-containing protein [Melanogaster broomeanus]|nr:Dihydroneopterin aldolase-domain-containing protein [Melanogaster broomeanus]